VSEEQFVYKYELHEMCKDNVKCKIFVDNLGITFCLMIKNKAKFNSHESTLCSAMCV